MKNVVYKYGLLAGAIEVIVGFGLMSLLVGDKGIGIEYGELLGYTTMIVALSMIFFGVKAYRDEYQQGVITFGKAAQVGILITLVASAIYVVGWLIYFHLGSGEEIMNAYVDMQIAEVQNSGRPNEAIEQEIVEIKNATRSYKEQPLFMIGITFIEIFPVGLIISLISAALLRKQDPQLSPAVNT